VTCIAGFIVVSFKLQKLNRRICASGITIKMRLIRTLLVLLISLSVCSPDQSFAQVSEQSKTFDSLLTLEEKQYLANLDTLTVCSVAQAVGSNASIDLIRMLTAKTGIKVDASAPLAWEQGVQGLASGTCDILPWATDTLERRKTMNFTQPYARLVRVIVTRIEQPYISNIKYYLDKVYVTEKNNHVVEQLKKQFPNLITVRVEHTIQGLQLVAEGKAFASIASLYSVGNLFNRPEANELKIAGQLPAEFDDVVSLATRKSDAILASILNKAVETTEHRAVTDFLNRSAVFISGNETDYRKYWFVGLSMLLVVIGLLGWIKYLRGLNTRLARIQTKLKQKTKELERLSITDSLTNTYNRHKLDSDINKEIARANRYSNQLSLIMLDIDFFKDINDEFGHVAGDEILVAFAKLLRENLRDNDVLGRWGGEEFLIICSGIGVSSAASAAEKLRKIIDLHDFSPAQGITASFGVTEWKTSDTKESLVLKADKALYQAKREGRNRVCVELNNC
jgi:diguanylate cyclase (GGDEF)-like protein